MGDLLSLIRQRQSCRNFDPGRFVEKEKLMDILQAAALSPSACNSQPWRYIAVDEPQRVEQVAQCLQDSGMNKFAGKATAFVVAIEGKQNLTAKVGESLKNQKFSGIDLGLSVAHLVLAAEALGLSSCILGWFNERKLKMLLGIPKTRRIRLVVALGYAMADDVLRDKQRKKFDEVISFNKF
ncbi:nitroreductase family protein [Oscillospiraceae bacterium LTW-04]|nr:nitroreductase family protein [Oscillospiraceae bacterium MB24-C1]